MKSFSNRLSFIFLLFSLLTKKSFGGTKDCVRRRRNLFKMDDTFADHLAELSNDSKTPSCVNVDYKMTCDEVLELQGVTKITDIKFPDLNLPEDLNPRMRHHVIKKYLEDVNTASGIGATYMCCRISNAWITEFESLSMLYEEFCDVNFKHFTKQNEIINMAMETDTPIGYFDTLVKFCPKRITSEYQQELSRDQIEVTPWSKITYATLRNEKIKDLAISNGECKSVTIDDQVNPDHNGYLTVILADEDIFYGSLKVFTGLEITEENLYIWGTYEDLFTLEVVRNIHGTPMSVYGFKIGRAIRFSGINEQEVKEGWKEWIKTNRYSLLDRSCVHSAVNLLDLGLPENVCHFNHNLQFPFPQAVFDQILKIGQSTTLGTELGEDEIEKIQTKIYEWAEKNKKEASLAKKEILTQLDEDKAVEIQDVIGNQVPIIERQVGSKEEWKSSKKEIDSLFLNSSSMLNMLCIIIGTLLGVTIYHFAFQSAKIETDSISLLFSETA